MVRGSDPDAGVAQRREDASRENGRAARGMLDGTCCLGEPIRRLAGKEPAPSDSGIGGRALWDFVDRDLV
jgi:hypothetical protein